MKNLKLFIPITKVDEEKRLVYGIATAEQPDQLGEICDYATTVPYYKSWSERMDKASEGKSKGNLRSMHASIAAGKLTQIVYNDDQKQIEVCGKVIDDDEWKKVIEGVYTGFSQGGRYVKTWRDGEYTRYTADPAEISLVDNPCLTTATFTLVRAGGTTEMRKFKTITEKEMTKDTTAPAQVWQAKDGSTYATKADALKKNAEIDATASAQPGLDAAAEIDKVLSKAEGGEKEEEKEVQEVEKAEEKPEEKKESEAKDDEAAEKAAPVDFKKYVGSEVWDAGTAMNALASIQCLIESEADEDHPEAASQLADLQEVIARLKSFIASEIKEDTEGAEMAMATAAGDLEKKGAAISATTKGHLEKMMKSANDHMETMQECYKAMGMAADDAEKAVTVDLEKSAKLEDENEALHKTINTLNGSMETILKRVQHLESQPLPGKGALFRVDKNHEVQTGDEPVEIATVHSMPNRVSPEEYRRQFNV